MFESAGRNLKRVFVAPVQRRQVMLAATVLLALTLLTGLVWPVLSEYARELDQRLETRSLEHRNFQHLLAGQDEYALQVEQLRAFQERLSRDHFVQASSPPLSEAMFQNIVNELSADSDVHVVSMRMLPRAERDGVLVLRLVINARAEVAAIKDFVLTVENNPRLIFFEEIEIRQISQNERRLYHFNAHLAAVTKN